MSSVYTSADIAKKLGVTRGYITRTFRDHHDRDGMPLPVTSSRPYRWEKTGFDFWFTRQHPLREGMTFPANDVLTSLEPLTIEEHRADLHAYYAAHSQPR